MNLKFRPQPVEKTVGIEGLDQITGGACASGRPTLVCGGAGSGRTLFAMEFLVRGATEHDENGVIMAFEETAKDLTENVQSLGFDLDSLIAQKKLVVDFVRLNDRRLRRPGTTISKASLCDLLHAIDTVGAKRVVLDTSRLCSPVSPTKQFCAPNCEDYFAG